MEKCANRLESPRRGYMYGTKQAKEQVYSEEVVRGIDNHTTVSNKGGCIQTEGNK